MYSSVEEDSCKLPSTSGAAYAKAYFLKFSQIDLDTENAKILFKKRDGKRLLEVARSLETLNQQTRDMAYQEEHKLVWTKEYIRLQEQAFRMDQENWCKTMYKKEIWAEDAMEILRMMMKFEESRSDFKEKIVDPMWLLREDLQDWLDRHELEKPLLPSTYMSHHQIQEILRTVWCDYFIMIQKLDNELEESERELQKASTIILEERGHQSSKSILEKYEELPFLSSPVHDKLLNQLHQLDLRYKIKIEDLGEKSLKDVCLTDTWRTSEKSVLYHILEQYPSGMLNKWTLCSDRLKRTFPEKSTKDLVTLTQLSESQQLYTKQRNAILNSWLQDRKKWQNKAVKEVCDAHNKFLVRKASKEAQVCQKAVCDQLRIKLEKMKEEKKMEKLKEEEKASKYQETMKKANKMTAMKEKQRREIEKEMLKSYFEEKLRMQNENQEDLCRLLQEMKVVRKQQMKYNRKRVQFRESVLSKKKSVQLNRKEAQKQQVEDKEKHLYALVSQVRAKVKKDPSRVLQHTAASLTRKYTNKCDPRPFKPFHSFTEEQILCDHRLRLEQLLRQADLINSKYGIAVMKQVQPFREPRKDMKSTVFEEI